MATEAANLDKNLVERQHLRKILQHGMRKITKIGYCGAQRKKAFQGRSGPLHQILLDFQNRRKKKMPLWFGAVKITSDLCRSSFCGTLRAEARQGIHPVLQTPPYIKWFCPSKTKWLYIWGAFFMCLMWIPRYHIFMAHIPVTITHWQFFCLAWSNKDLAQASPTYLWGLF